MEVIRSTTHVTTCGTVATYYFQKYAMPPFPTMRALGRALTTSFGSICLGSFLVALLHACREMVVIIRSQTKGSEAAAIIASCAECVLQCLENIVRYFNKWAYVQVAVYGKSFAQAARDTWDLIHSQGFNLVINDDLTSSALFLGCAFGGVASALVAGIWTYLLPITDVQGWTAVIVAISFIIGFSITYLTVSVVESAVSTYFVCFAEDPATLQRNDPHLYHLIAERHHFLQPTLS
eukprot:TRINITY_DN2240_c0_g1_i3.p1 TRINITY_DN2240_c0_g1~~TRINITY_DN2240_c0_g1_i3.p1  ORF type:complete len:236 (-),score=23.01 TRINITY_DN2240_c0_g1_i3:741-1448(-)